MAKLPLDVQQSIRNQVPKLEKTRINKEFKTRFDKLKEDMIKEFLSHPVTVELLSGPYGTNISGTLGGVSNLFAFIGFSTNDNPIEPILQILQSMDYQDKGPSGKNVGKVFRVNIPTPEDIFAITPMPWATGRSWAKGIETGISGIGYLLNKSSKSSRSGVAIQADRKVRSGRFQNTPYISALLKKYQKKFKELS